MSEAGRQLRGDRPHRDSLCFPISRDWLILARHRAGGAGINAVSRRDDLDSRNLEQSISDGDGAAVSPTMIANAIHLAAAAGLGGLAGLLGGLFGVGGGFLVIPLLGFFW